MDRRRDAQARPDSIAALTEEGKQKQHPRRVLVLLSQHGGHIDKGAQHRAAQRRPCPSRRARCRPERTARREQSPYIVERGDDGGHLHVWPQSRDRHQDDGEDRQDEKAIKRPNKARSAKHRSARTKNRISVRQAGSSRSVHERCAGNMVAQVRLARRSGPSPPGQEATAATMAKVNAPRKTRYCDQLANFRTARIRRAVIQMQNPLTNEKSLHHRRCRAGTLERLGLLIAKARSCLYLAV